MPIPEITWSQALAWRLRRHYLADERAGSVEEVVGRLCGVQAQVASSADLAVRVRHATSVGGEVGAALDDGRVIKTWAMRGTLHLLRPDDGGAFLRLIADGRSWERPSWIRYFHATPDDVETLRVAVAHALEGRVLSREELIAAVTAQPGLGHVAETLRSGWGTLLKPIAWQGDLCFGPQRGSRVTFQRPVDASRGWAGLPSAEDAAPVAIAAYLGAYGPASADSFANWLAGGWFPKRRVKALFAEMGDRLAEVSVEGERLWVRREDLDEVAAAQPTKALRLLGGFDQWVLGPTTADIHVLAAARRTDVSRQSGWIAPIVIAGGVVRGTWDLDRDTVRVAWFRESGRAPRTALQGETQRLATLLGRTLTVEIAAV
jgi:hypothetical protein